MNRLFIEAFAERLNYTIQDAKAAWTAHSRQLGDKERLEIEAMGHVSGTNEADKYREEYELE